MSIQEPLIPEGAIPIIPRKLYFYSAPESFSPPQSSGSIFYCTDESLIYTAFFADFGPLSLGLIAKFCTDLDQLLNKTAIDKPLIYYCSDHPHRRSNSAVLICAYLVSFLTFLSKICAVNAYIFRFLSKTSLLSQHMVPLLESSRHLYHFVMLLFVSIHSP